MRWDGDVSGDHKWKKKKNTHQTEGGQSMAMVEVLSPVNSGAFQQLGPS